MSDQLYRIRCTRKSTGETWLAYNGESMTEIMAHATAADCEIAWPDVSFVVVEYTETSSPIVETNNGMKCCPTSNRTLLDTDLTALRQNKRGAIVAHVYCSECGRWLQIQSRFGSWSWRCFPKHKKS